MLREPETQGIRNLLQPIKAYIAKMADEGLQAFFRKFKYIHALFLRHYSESDLFWLLYETLGKTEILAHFAC